MERIGGQGTVMADEDQFSVVAVSFFGKWSVGTFPTREQAEWRAKELNDWSERYPRGIIQYLVQPAEKPRGER
jgi:hypothetical protein